MLTYRSSSKRRRSSRPRSSAPEGTAVEPTGGPMAPRRMASCWRSSASDRIGKDVAGADVAICPEVVLGRLHGDPGCLDHLQRLCHHLGTDAVPADDRHLVRAHSPQFPLSSRAGRLVLVLGLLRLDPHAADSHLAANLLPPPGNRIGRFFPGIEKPPTKWTVERHIPVGMCLLNNGYRGGDVECRSHDPPSVPRPRGGTSTPPLATGHDRRRDGSGGRHGLDGRAGRPGSTAEPGEQRW